jgi:hypothetical protein
MQNPEMQRWFEDICLKWNVFYRIEKG